MTDASGVAAPPLPGLFDRVIGIITAPKAMFEKVVQTPRIIGILAFSAFVMGASQAAFVATERGQQASIDFQTQQQEKFYKTFGITPSQEVLDASATRMQRMAPYQKYISFVNFFVGLPIGLLIFGGILFVVFNVIMGGSATFKQVLAVLAHSSIVSALGFVFGMVIAFSSGRISTSPANLGLLLPMLPEGSFAANLFGSLDVFGLWGTIVTAIGLGVLYKRSGRNIAIALLSLTVCFVALFAYLSSR